MELIGGTTYYGCYWSSTQESSTRAWVYNHNSAQTFIGETGKSYLYKVRPCAILPL
jgi:hypothetical protein